jgi:filamentous hemagglutinin family protein
MRSSLVIPFISLLCLPIPAVAQTIVPDNSLGTIVNSNAGNMTITGGQTGGSNLFHSFQKFSIPTGMSATFDLINTPNVQTIFSRITGTDRSNIDGLLRITNGNTPVSLFLMNPNGIVFGPNAQLDISGSFLGTTADRLQFKDGLDFTSTPSTTQLLSISVPIGLQMGKTPGDISVQGSGHLLRTQNPILAPYFSIGIAPGLRVQSGNTLALVGGNLTIDGGVLTAPEGRVELASAGSLGSVPIFQNTLNIALGDVVGDRGNIALSNKALIDVNEIDGGSIQVQGKQVDLTTGAILWVQNRGSNLGGDIQINATDRISLNGTASDLIAFTPSGVLFKSVSAIVNEVVGVGNGGKIVLNAPQITVQDSATIMSRPFAKGAGGDINIKAQTLTISDTSKDITDFFSVISSNTSGLGRGGNILATVRDISLLNGGTLSASTIGPGNSGNITVNADTVLVSGLSPKFSASSLTSPTIGGTGNAGNLLLNTRKLTIREGGIVVASSVGPGNAGGLTINATESIEITGLAQKNPNIYNSGIASAVSIPQEPYLSLFQIKENLIGSSGDVKISTPKLTISKGGYITVDNFGTGIAGSLMVNADRIELSNESYFSAGSMTGQGGNIIIHSDTVLLRNQGKIFTSAQGNGNGGNISITASTITGVENSDIFANAEAGNGGAISIKTQGLFGLKFRDRLTPGNDITASSQSGINGTVQINNFTIDPSAALNALPANLSNGSQQVASGCNSRQENRFVVTGRGGIPKDPSQKLNRSRTWEDLRPLTPSASISAVPIAATAIPMVEASSIQHNPDGTIALIAPATPAHLPNPATCSQP